MWAVIRVRGSIDTNPQIRDALRILNLNSVNHCILVRQKPEIEGMLKKVRDYVTWGEISAPVLESLILKRGRLLGNKRLDEKKAKDFVNILEKAEKGEKVKDMKKVFRLSPPKKGYKAVRRAYPKGALGYRGEKINELLERMI